MSSLVTLSIVVFVILSITMIILLNTFIISLARKFQANHKEFEKNTDDLNHNHEQSMLQSYTDTQERTFEDISRELHDNIGQQLSLANFYMSSIDVSDKKKLLDQLQDLKLIIGYAINDLSNLNKSISNQVLSSNGLIYAIERELQLMKKAGNYEVNFEVEGQTTYMSSQSELIIFRVVQELLNNIIKHSQATLIKMQIAYKNNLFDLSLHDNGLGIDTSSIVSTGFGLGNIQKRIAMLKAEYACTPEPGRGTTITIKIPVYD